MLGKQRAGKIGGTVSELKQIHNRSISMYNKRQMTLGISIWNARQHFLCVASSSGFLNPAFSCDLGGIFAAHNCQARWKGRVVQLALYTVVWKATAPDYHSP